MMGKGFATLLLEIGQHHVQGDDTDDWNAIAGRNLLDGALAFDFVPDLTTLLPVQRDNHASRLGACRLGACRFNECHHLANGGARRDHVIDNQDTSGQLGTHNIAAFAMRLRLFAIEGKRQVATVMIGQRHGTGCRQRNPLVSGAEQHINSNAAGCNRLGIEAAQPRQGGTATKQSGIEEIGADTARLESKLAEFQHTLFNGELDELTLIGLHTGRHVIPPVFMSVLP